MSPRHVAYDWPAPPRHAAPHDPGKLVTALVTEELLEDVLEALARHGEHPPPERVAAALDRLLLDA